MTETRPQEHRDAQPPRGLRVGELLVRRGLITPEQLEAALRRQRVDATKLLGHILVEMDAVAPEQVVRVLAESVGRPFVRLTPSMVCPEALRCLPAAFLEEHNLLPLSVEEGSLTIAVEQFTNVFLIAQIEHRSGYKVHVIAAEPENIRQTRESARTSAPTSTIFLDEAGGSFGDILRQIGVDDLRVVEAIDEDDVSVEAAAAAKSPVVKLVNYIVKSAVEASVSDIHIEPQDDCFRVRYRIDGDLVTSITPPRHLLAAIVSRIKIMAGMDISERRLPQDGSVSVALAGRSVDMRISTMAARFGEKVVMRIVDRSAKLLGLDTLGIEPEMLARFRAVIREPNGLVLVTGPTGSGKSTTLYGALADITSDRRNVSTIEDPVERTVAGTNQFQVREKAGFTFARALRSMLRQDPDIIMVGEIRDREAATLATEAALTGHLVLSTLHTNDAPTAVPRLVNMGVEAHLVAASLRGVLAQRLVRRICPHCRKAVRLTDVQRAAMSRLSAADHHRRIDSAFVGSGCARCRDMGTAGRIGVFDLLLLNEAVLSAIVRDPDAFTRRMAACKRGIWALLADGLEKVQRGVIELECLLEIASRTDEYLSDEVEAADRAA